jgi:hypothetical protein
MYLEHYQGGFQWSSKMGWMYVSVAIKQNDSLVEAVKYILKY